MQTYMHYINLPQVTKLYCWLTFLFLIPEIQAIGTSLSPSSDSANRLFPYIDKVLESMFLLAFFGFPCCSEFTASKLNYHPSQNATLSDISIKWRDGSRTQSLNWFTSVFLPPADTIPSFSSIHPSTTLISPHPSPFLPLSFHHSTFTPSSLTLQSLIPLSFIPSLLHPSSLIPSSHIPHSRPLIHPSYIISALFHP